jgi:hypothetical protein
MPRNGIDVRGRTGQLGDCGTGRTTLDSEVNRDVQCIVP